MLTSERDKRICEKYSARDETGYVHCAECPLNLARMHPKEYGKYDFMCKATCHYDWKKGEWVPDECGD